MSNAVGSNVFDILVCLGVPWFLQTCIMKPGSTVPVYSSGNHFFYNKYHNHSFPQQVQLELSILY